MHPVRDAPGDQVPADAGGAHEVQQGPGGGAQYLEEGAGPGEGKRRGGNMCT